MSNIMKTNLKMLIIDEKNKCKYIIFIVIAFTQNVK